MDVSLLLYSVNIFFLVHELRTDYNFYELVLFGIVHWMFLCDPAESNKTSHDGIVWA